VPPARGRCIATRALAVVSQWMFANVGLHRLELQHSTANPDSCRVAEKTGYRYEGTKRRQALHLDGWHDMHLRARLAGDPV
jgi:ribosomal-protein-alanine N-acetyltransferase